MRNRSDLFRLSGVSRNRSDPPGGDDDVGRLQESYEFVVIRISQGRRAGYLAPAGFANSSAAIGTLNFTSASFSVVTSRHVTYRTTNGTLTPLTSR